MPHLNYRLNSLPTSPLALAECNEVRERVRERVPAQAGNSFCLKVTAWGLTHPCGRPGPSLLRKEGNFLTGFGSEEKLRCNAPLKRLVQFFITASFWERNLQVRNKKLLPEFTTVQKSFRLFGEPALSFPAEAVPPITRWWGYR